MLTVPSSRRLTAFTLTFLLLWWFLPPPETRYALTGIITLLLLEFIALFKYQTSSIKTIALWFIVIAIGFNFSIRLAVTYKNLPVILGTQTQNEYVKAHTTDFNREKMDKYYSGYWLKLVNFKAVQ